MIGWMSLPSKKIFLIFYPATIYVNTIEGIAIYQSLVTPKYNPKANPTKRRSSIVQSGSNRFFTYFLMWEYYLLSSVSFILDLTTF